MRINKSAWHLLLTLTAFVCLLGFPNKATAQTKTDISSDASVIAAGEKIFSSNCVACHAIDKDVVGPKLKGVYKRQKVEWIIAFIKGPQAVIESGDKHAKEIFKKYNSIYMPNHDFLSDDEIMSILAYVKDKTENPTVAETATGGGNTEGGAVLPPNPLTNWVVVGFVVLLLVVVIILSLLVSVLVSNLNKKRNDLSEADQKFLDQRVEFGSFFRSSGFIGVVSFVLIALFAKVLLDGMFTIGVQQGYAPDQPIPFSHKLHAGYYEIDCKYCHTGVEKSKNANIPSPNICMNCHNTIRTTSPNIQKIYAAIEKNEPIEWVRVHNLPDLSYFNHSQHVKVGGLDCTQCHGDIKNMEVVQQHSLLTMGWCVDCHRKTELNTDDNPYYDNLKKAHKDVATPLKVEDMGGLECSKCHY